MQIRHASFGTKIYTNDVLDVLKKGFTIGAIHELCYSSRCYGMAKGVSQKKTKMTNMWKGKGSDQR